MNHINTQAIEIARLTAERDALLSGLDDIRIYLNSSKFHVDRSVCIDDIFLRIEEVKRDANDKADSAAGDKKNEINERLAFHK